MELTTVADDEAVFFDQGQPLTLSELDADTVYEQYGARFKTLPRRGELLCRFATVNDVHFGETMCGAIGETVAFATFSVEEGTEPYPEFMNRGAVAEIAAIDPVTVVVKGDLTSSGTEQEYREFLSVYEPVFGDRLVHVRGNHDSYHGGSFAAFATQEIVVPGATLAVLDTARSHQVNGSIDAEQLEWLDELATRTAEPVMVFGHHNMWNPEIDVRSDSYFGVVPDDSEALFEVFARRTNLVGYFAGHTHRNHTRRIAAANGAPFVEVACVKDYPGSWAEYRIHEGDILQIHRRVSTPDALSWTERTRHMFGGAYQTYAFGELADRCFEIAR